VFYKAFFEVYNAVVESKEHFMTIWIEQFQGDDILEKVTAKRFKGLF